MQPVGKRSWKNLAASVSIAAKLTLAVWNATTWYKEITFLVSYRPDLAWPDIYEKSRKARLLADAQLATERKGRRYYLAATYQTRIFNQLPLNTKG